MKETHEGSGCELPCVGIANNIACMSDVDSSISDVSCLENVNSGDTTNDPPLSDVLLISNFDDVNVATNTCV